jgi:hypothetical protein
MAYLCLSSGGRWPSIVLRGRRALPAALLAPALCRAGPGARGPGPDDHELRVASVMARASGPPPPPSPPCSC